MEFEEIVKIVQEETIPDRQRQIAGIQTQEVNPDKVSVFDLLQQQNMKDAQPETNLYPLNKYSDISSDCFLEIHNLQTLFKQAYINPAIKDKKKVKKAFLLTKHLEDKIVELTEIVDRIR